MTFREYIRYWQKTYDRQACRPSTYNSHGYMFNNHILPGLGDIPVSELTEEKIGAFLEERQRCGGHRPQSPNYPGLGPEILRHIQTLLQKVLDQAVKDGLLTSNPAKPFRTRKPDTVNANVLSAAESEAYLDAAEKLGYLPLFMLALTAGLRQRELLALKWSDLDVRNRKLTIHEGRSVVGTKLVEYEGESRTISLTGEMTNLLKWEHEQHPESPLMFMQPATLHPYSPLIVRRMHDEILREAGLKHVRFADLRHTFAVNALQNGMELRELAQILGHARTVLTKKDYGAYIGEKVTTADKPKSEEEKLQELKEASAQMDNLLNFCIGRF